MALDANSKKVYISKIVDHPALDSTVEGIKDALKEKGYIAGSNLELVIESAQGNASLAAQIAAKFAGHKPDVTVGVGTGSAQPLAKYAQKGEVKLVFSSITDPIGANLVKNLEHPDSNTSGVSNFVDLKPQLELFKKLQPTLTTLGIIYNPGELNSVAIVNKLKVEAPKLGITLIEQAANRTTDIPQATTKLVNQVDAIFISNDNTALSALSNIIAIATKVKKPVYVSDTAAVVQGALAALGPNQYDIGIQTGQIIAEILAGKNINELPVQFPTKTDLYLNTDTAKTLGIAIPQELLEKAVKIIGNSK